MATRVASWLAVLIIAGFTCVWLAFKGKGRRGVLFFALAAGLSASVGLTDWPLRLAFLASKSQLDRLADRLEQGNAVAPTWVGTFCIRKAELREDMPCLWISLEPSGFTGLARPVDGIALGKYNDWSDARLSSKWHLIKED